jgi:phosphoadenosine phosphosulfate reductase
MVNITTTSSRRTEMSDLAEKVKTSIKRLQAFEPVEGYRLAFSGGKDSVVIKALAEMANIKYTPVYRLTSVDPPELVRFIKKCSDVTIEIPRDNDGNQITMWNLIVKQGMAPTRTMRFCCKQFKETSCDGELVVTGVRWAESYNRTQNQGAVTIAGKGMKPEDIGDDGTQSKTTRRGGLVLNYDNDESARMDAQCYRTNKTLVNPIIDWEDSDVWGFIRGEGVPYCELYDEGYKRLGCIGCPMQTTKERFKNFGRWPTYKIAYMHAFERMIQRRKERGKPIKRVTTAEEYFHWWIEDGVLPGQTDLFGEIDELEDV